MITSGAIEALELLGKSFLDPGDLVVVEGPTYLGAIMAFRSFEAERARGPDGRGRARRRRARAPARTRAARRSCSTRSRTTRTRPGSASRPSGARALVELARRHGFLIVEDVAYRELGFDGDARRRASGASGRTSSCRSGRSRRRSSPACGSAGRPARPRSSAQLVVAKQNTDQCAGALGQKLLEGYARRG